MKSTDIRTLLCLVYSSCIASNLEMARGELHLTAILLCAFMIYGYCFSVLSPEIQNDFDQSCTLTDKIVTKGNASFRPTGDQSVSSNGGKTDLTVTIHI